MTGLLICTVHLAYAKLDGAAWLEKTTWSRNCFRNLPAAKCLSQVLLAKRAACKDSESSVRLQSRERSRDLRLRAFLEDLCKRSMSFFVCACDLRERLKMKIFCVIFLKKKNFSQFRWAITCSFHIYPTCGINGFVHLNNKGKGCLINLLKGHFVAAFGRANHSQSTLCICSSHQRNPKLPLWSRYGRTSVSEC
uniref:Uncharacterized protein n=1 Tax=Micrurus lemniscatus lemniscatus TaxID=129467 RepID=A0A2D4I8Y9_MICLE